MDVNIRALRKKLMDHYGTAVASYPMAQMKLAEIERASDEEILLMAEKQGMIQIIRDDEDEW